MYNMHKFVKENYLFIRNYPRQPFLFRILLTFYKNSGTMFIAIAKDC